MRVDDSAETVQAIGSRSHDMVALDQVAMPPQHRIRAHQEPAQPRADQGHEQDTEQRPVRRPQSWTLIAELPVQDRDLMVWSEDLDILLSIGHAQEWRTQIAVRFSFHEAEVAPARLISVYTGLPSSWTARQVSVRVRRCGASLSACSP